MNAHAPTTDDIADALSSMRDAAPLVHAITNYVTAGFTANVLLAAGASVAMVDNIDEAALFTGVADALLINLGTPQPALRESYLASARVAHDTGTPWVLDPIGAGGLPWRGALASELLQFRPHVIRGNASEIIGLHGLDPEVRGRGVDSSADPADAVDSARALLEFAGAVSASGAIDHVVGKAGGPSDSDGRGLLVTVAGGTPLLTKVTGAGCSLGALVAAYASVVDPLTALVSAHAHVAVAADAAAERFSSPGSFAVAYLDALHDITPDDLRTRAKIST